MTKEHAWPQWLGQGQQVEPTQTTREIGFGRSADNAMTEAPNRVVIKPGSVLKARVREVCAGCNNGWMSRLEEGVRPLLERLWQPSYPFGVTAFTPDEAAVIATWAAKTAWVRERVSDSESTPTPGMRAELMDRQMPPGFTSVWIARHQGQSKFGVYAARIEIYHQDDHWATARRRQVLICTMTFRGLSVLVRTDDGWVFPRWSRLPRNGRRSGLRATRSSGHLALQRPMPTYWPLPRTTQTGCGYPTYRYSTATPAAGKRSAETRSASQSRMAKCPANWNALPSAAEPAAFYPGLPIEA
jgi:hypothetical protein